MEALLSFLFAIYVSGDGSFLDTHRERRSKKRKVEGLFFPLHNIRLAKKMCFDREGERKIRKGKAKEEARPSRVGLVAGEMRVFRVCSVARRLLLFCSFLFP